jgi:histidine ammonia-lyase
LLVAAQGIDLRKRGAIPANVKPNGKTGQRQLKTSPALEKVIRLLRARVPMLEDDRHMAGDLAAAAALVASGSVLAAVKGANLPQPPAGPA